MARRASLKSLPKTPTGIRGLDEITKGGLPKGRTSLICGSAGCGKTILGMEFIARGATMYGEPGVFMAFEETVEELVKNFSSMGFDLKELERKKLLAIDYVYIERSEIEETGHYDLDGLFVRLQHAIESIGAKRVVLDTLEALFSGLSDTAVLRAELRRLFRWLREKGVTAIVTGERGEGMLTRYGLEEYVADCVMLLDLRVRDQIATRRLRIVKYRGSEHGGDEYPFLIDESGISIMPLSSSLLNYGAPTKRISSGVSRLDKMLGGKGYYRASTVLVSGTAGSGKTSLAAAFIDAACRRGERCLYFAFEESPEQIMRNMRSIGINLEPWLRKGLLRFHAARPSMHGLEMHLASMHRDISEADCSVVVIDPISNLVSVGTMSETKSMLTRLIDFLKSRGITGLFTELLVPGVNHFTPDEKISSLIDTWIALQDITVPGERNRGLHILKSRGMPHSNQIREFLLTDDGISLLDVYLGPSGVLTGSARATQEAIEREEAEILVFDQQRRQRELENKRKDLERQISQMRTEFARLQAEAVADWKQGENRIRNISQGRVSMAKLRKADDIH